MTTEVATQNSNVPSTQVQSAQAPVLSGDIVIPRLLLMQGLSDFILERRKGIAIGDIVRSSNAQKLGDDKNPITIIPLTFQNFWSISEDQKGDGKYKFRRMEPRTASNENAEWDYIEGGTKWKRTKVMNLFALLPADIDAENDMLAKFKETGDMADLDGDKALLPVMISFRSTSYKAAKDIATLFAKAQSISEKVGRQIPVYGSTIKLSCYEETNDDGTFFVFKSEVAGKTDPKYIESAKNWLGILTQLGSSVKIDDSGEESAPAQDNSKF